MPQYAKDINGESGYSSDSNPTRITVNGNITVHPKRITHHALAAAAPLALTISLPGPNDDGKIMTFWAEDAIAHVITQAADGFNHKGAAGTATWSGVTQGDSLVLIAHGGSWWTLSKNVVVVA
jgi:hypothetical protein